MPASPLNFNSALITANYGWFWVGLAIPGAGARITLFTDGTPDSTANPTAKHLGHTTEGWEMTAAATTENITVDEQVIPIDTFINELNVGLAANLAQTQDISGTLQYIAHGFGTYGTAAGYEQITLGTIPIVYTACALISPTKADATKYLVYNLYKSINSAGIANQVKRRGLGSNPVAFQGYGITTRAAADSTGNLWKSI